MFATIFSEWLVDMIPDNGIRTLVTGVIERGLAKALDSLGGFFDLAQAAIG
ncbi:hypothetical protein [Photobacterium satsumensis]|uniref:hypothetical protein n=1 Tax=Photobacterium satsumensis TaxID=2910239 RepID=UPI003D1103D7